MSRLAVGKRRTSLLAASQRPTEKYPHGRTCGSAALPPLMRPTTGLVPPRHAVASVVQKFMADMFQACTYVQTCSGICARRVPADNYATMSEAKTVYCVPFASILDGTTRRANLHQSPSPGTVHPEHSVPKTCQCVLLFSSRDYLGVVPHTTARDILQKYPKARCRARNALWERPVRSFLPPQSLPNDTEESERSGCIYTIGAHSPLPHFNLYTHTPKTS